MAKLGQNDEKLKEKEGWGRFRDLEAFNLALLAKQGWRFLNGDNSLFYRLYEAKYFRNTSFLEAQAEPASSWAWQSFLASKEVVGRGWQGWIADGRRAKIFFSLTK
ncbi:hypothetical protein RHSIM_RhsimUnG0066400 [Rhododendron simsii]|uniref:Uncharacterized protein n=1 Tax=Rhododendron simsii TaxID=118357 RepID=A0A834FWD0_RHOSS|nr:hypothetical protein RHSIM_RhsimUnG0066400 [Rhododendron simsii]